MSANAIVNGKQETAGITHTEDSDNSDKPVRRGNPLMRSLTPDMIREPYELDFADGMMSNEFAWEKTSKQIIETLEFRTEKEWLDYAKTAWKWHLDLHKRQAEATALKILADASENPMVLEVLKQKLNG